MEALSYSKSCYIVGGDFEETRKALAFFQHLPNWIFIFNVALGVYLKDFFFFASNTFTQLIILYYFSSLAQAFQSPRPPIFDHVLCHKPQYGVPDGLFIATISYVIVLVCGLFMNRQTASKIGLLYKIGFVVVPVLYLVSVAVNGYYFWWQFVINLALSFVASFGYVFVYWKVITLFRIPVPWRRWIDENLGYETMLFLENRLPPSEIVRKRHEAEQQHNTNNSDSRRHRSIISL